MKESTAVVYGHTRRCLISFFGAEKPLKDITRGDADAWRIWLATHEGLADNTVRRRSGIAKQFFRSAVRKKLIAENPFDDLVCTVRKNERRHYFITRAEAQKVIDACPDAEWRLIFALSRFGGLRCPSEHLALRWSDVDWTRGRITVHSPKTEHHQGGESREIPLFRELRPYLEDAWQPDAQYVITRYRDTNCNLRTYLLKIIAKAGLKPWPKLFQNLRSTRETELVETFPIHVACKWIGNSEAVAKKHYLQMRDAYFEEASRGANLVQQPTETPRNASQPENVAVEKPREMPHFAMGLGGFAVPCERDGMGGTGLEPVTSTV